MSTVYIKDGVAVRTGNDLRAYKLATSAAEKAYNRALSRGADDITASILKHSTKERMMAQWNRFQHIMTDPIRSGMKAGRFKETRIHGLPYQPGAGPLWEKAKRQAELEKRREDLWQYPRSGVIEADEIAIREASRNEAQRRGEQIAQTRDAVRASRLARATSGFQRYVAEESKIGSEPPANENSKTGRVQQNIIARGIRRAFGGRRLTVLRDLFGFNFGYGHIIRAMTSFAVNQSHYQQAMHLAAINAGTSADRLQMLGLGSKIFGGNESDAASVYASINDFLHGSRYGYGFGKLENLYRFGVRIHPGMSANEVLRSIADRYSQLPMEDRAVMARSIGMPPAIQDMMSKGGDSFMAELEHMREYVPSNIEALRENSKAVRELSVAAQTLGRELIPILTPVAKSMTEGVNFASDIVRFLKGEDTGNYNVVRDFFENLLNPSKNTPTPAVGGAVFRNGLDWTRALEGVLTFGGVGMSTFNPYEVKTENRIIVDVNADPEFRDRLFNAISNNVSDYYTNKWLVPLELTNNIEVW